MKKYVILLALCFVCAFANAQGMLRTIIFADNNDDRIGKGVQCNLEEIQEQIDIIASCIGMEDKTAAPLIYEQFNCNPKHLRECIKNFKCGTDDIVLFFYFGHGGRSPQDRSEFPQMCLGTDFSKQNLWVPLEDVKNEIGKQHPRFLLVFGDLCNSSDPGISPKYGVLNSASASEISATQKEAMKRLFLNCRGSVIASGSTKGEYSWYYNVHPDGGGFFTTVFQVELEGYTSKTASADWETLLGMVKNGVVGLTKELKSRNPDMTIQTPRFKVDVTYNGQTPKPNNDNETKKIDQNNNNLVDNNNNKQVNNNDFQSVLVDIANERNTPTYRIKKRASVLSHFANSDVWVDIIGRNNRTVVSSERASDFVERISTAFHLRNFTILDCQRDGNGKITALKVHEIYER